MDHALNSAGPEESRGSRTCRTSLFQKAGFSSCNTWGPLGLLAMRWHRGCFSRLRS